MLDTRDLAASQIVYHGEHGSSSGIALSPGGDRAVPYAGGSSEPGPPVLDAATGELAYLIEQLAWTEGATFSKAGDTLFVVGTTAMDPAISRNVLLVLDAESGSEIREIDLGEYSPYDVALDPDGRWAYVGGFEQGAAVDEGRLHVLVIDLEDLSIAGHMAPPPDQKCDFWCSIRGTMVVGDDGIFFVTQLLEGGDIFVFDRAPQ